jgi:hypothetical protein
VRDWLGVYAAGSSTYLDWKYLNGTQVATTGVTTAAVPFSMPHAGGSYVLRLYSGTTLLAVSEAVTVTAITTTITASASTVAPGGSVTATITNGPGNRTDWIATYPHGASTYLDWRYLNGTQVAPATGLTDAMLTYTMPSAPGLYTLRFFAGHTLRAASAIIEVALPPATSGATIAPIAMPSGATMANVIAGATAK